MHRLQDLLPDARNPMRPVVVILALGFGALLIAFPVGMRLLGLGTAGTIGVTLLIVLVAAVCLGFTLSLARGYDRDRDDLLAEEAWASWEISPEEHRRFVAVERGRMWRKAAAYGFGGLALGIILGVARDWILGGTIIGAFLLATAVILFAGGPPRGRTVQEREVRIGPRGVWLLGRYLPLEATGTRAYAVRLAPGDPAELRFGVRSGRTLDELRVPVPREKLPEAEALVERFRRELGLTSSR